MTFRVMAWNTLISKKIRMNAALWNKSYSQCRDVYLPTAKLSGACRIRSIYLRWPALYSIKLITPKNERHEKTNKKPFSRFLIGASADDGYGHRSTGSLIKPERQILIKKCNSGDHHRKSVLTNTSVLGRWMARSLEIGGFYSPQMAQKNRLTGLFIYQEMIDSGTRLDLLQVSSVAGHVDFLWRFGNLLRICKH